MYLRIASYIISVLFMVFALDMAWQEKVLVTSEFTQKIIKSQSLRYGATDTYIINICNRSLNISGEAYYFISKSPTVSVERSGILGIPRRLFVNPEEKYIPYGYLLLVGLIALHILIFAYNEIFAKHTGTTAVYNVFSFFIYLWLMFF